MTRMLKNVRKSEIPTYCAENLKNRSKEIMNQYTLLQDVVGYNSGTLITHHVSSYTKAASCCSNIIS